MIAEAIMHWCGWTDVWYARPRTLWQSLVWGERWHVGVWTGPHFALLCVKHCDTTGEAERCLSPGSRTILGAAFKSLLKLRRYG